MSAKEIARMIWSAEDALRFYADSRNYAKNEADEMSAVERDLGSKARVALQVLKGEVVP